MLLKLSFNNIRNSLRDYAIYFITLVIAVAVFYVFNAVGGQTALLDAQDMASFGDVLTNVLSGLSGFVAVILGLLIVYASRFLMKRRNKEFALYMMLGMSKRRISATLLVEALMIGAISLVVGLLVGIGLSQLMSFVVAGLFDVDMSAYHFTVSGQAIVKTLLHFGGMYLVVMLFNSQAVTRMKLINLMQSGKKSEPVELGNPMVRTIAFLVSVGMLGYSYWTIVNGLDLNGLGINILLNIGGTILFFWSIAGFMLRAALAMKNHYYRGINSFTVRQIASKINTVAVSMSMICIMLFMTICTLASSFALRNGMHDNVERLCRADAEVASGSILAAFGDPAPYRDVTKIFKDHGHDLDTLMAESVHFHSYFDKDMYLSADKKGTRKKLDVKGAALGTILRISDYNKLREFYGLEPMSLADDQFAIIADLPMTKEAYDKVLGGKDVTATVCGHELRSAYDASQDGYIHLSAANENTGIFLVPDSAVDEDHAATDYVFGKYGTTDKEQLKECDERLNAAVKDVQDAEESEAKAAPASASSEDDVESALASLASSVDARTKIGVYEGVMAIGALLCFIGMYIGAVFLVTCGAILALRGLSDAVDSASRYETLRRIGVDKGDLHRSLLKQTAFFFLLPLLLAGLHSVFGMKFMTPLLSTVGINQIGGSVAGTIAIILAIYGGYFLITYIGSWRIIREKK